MKVPVIETRGLLKGWRGWIIGFAVMYLYYLVKYGYWDNPYEVDAREYESG
jgi:hypothetical protein